MTQLPRPSLLVHFVPASRVLLTALGLVLVVGPLVAIVLYALHPGSANSLLADARFADAIRNTIIVTAVATLTAAVFSLPMAWAIGRVPQRYRSLWDNLSILPAVVPPLVGAVGWLVLLSPRVGLINVWLGHVGIGPIEVVATPVGIGIIVGLYQVPFMFTSIRGALMQVSASYEQAARVFQTGPLESFIRITLPLIRPALVSSTLSVIMRSIANIGVPLILGQTARIYVLSNLLFSYIFSEGDTSRAAQLGLLFMAVAAALYFAQRLLQAKNAISTLQVRQARSEVAVVTATTRRMASLILIAYATLALILPLLGVLYLSFTSFWSPFVLEALYTVRNYTLVFGNTIAQGSVLTTLIAAFFGALFAVALAALACLNRTYLGSRWDRLNGYLLSIPLGVPPLVFGAGVLFTVIRLPVPVYGTVAALVWAYLAYWVAFAQQAAEPFFRQIPRAYDEAAAVTGDTVFARFGNIHLPLLAPSLFLVGGLLFLNMLTDLPLVVFLSAPGAPIMPAQLYAFWSQAQPVRAAAFAIEMIAIAMVTAAMIFHVRDSWFQTRAARRPR